jgi:hypothetical protein
VIDIELGPGGQRFVDAPEVGELYERAVTLKVPTAAVDALPSPPRTTTGGPEVAPGTSDTSLSKSLGAARGPTTSAGEAGQQGARASSARNRGKIHRAIL